MANKSARNITNMVLNISSPGVGGNDATVKQADPTRQTAHIKKEDFGFGDDALTLKQRMLEHKSITNARRVYRVHRGMTVCDDGDDEIAELYCEFMALISTTLLSYSNG